MGSKKERNKEKIEKREIKVAEHEAKEKELKKKKTNSIMWMLFCVSGMLLLWVSGFMSDTISSTSSPEELAKNLNENLSIESAETKGIVDCDDSLYAIYINGSTTGLAEASRAKNLYNRYDFTEKKEFNKAVNYLIHNSETDNDNTYIVLYGNIKDTKITNVEISYNNKSLDLIPITSPTNDYFITTVQVPKSDNVTSIDLKLFNNRDEDVTNDFK